MTRLYGRAPRNRRVNDYVPDVRFERTTIVSTIRLSGEQAPFIFKGGLTGDIFSAYVEKMLAPTLRQGDIVVMDNLSSHKVSGALEPIYQKGACVFFLPPYSPDLNPIELSWAKMKAGLKKLKPRTTEELIPALQIALNSFTQEDIANWFKHDGYTLNF
jgi:transposase